jgi:hypothetical protein
MAHLWVAALIAVGLAGCDSTEAPGERVLPIRDPSVPWQAEPFAVAAPVLAAAIASCQQGGIPAEARPVLADARGQDRIVVLFESADRKTNASCSTLRSSDGTWQSTSSGVTQESEARPLPAAGRVEMPSVGTEGGDTINGLTALTRTMAIGRAGAGVAGVQFIVAGRPIAASVGNGWFAAWWPTGDPVTQLTALGADGQPLPSP